MNHPSKPDQGGSHASTSVFLNKSGKWSDDVRTWTAAFVSRTLPAHQVFATGAVTTVTVPASSHHTSYLVRRFSCDVAPGGCSCFITSGGGREPTTHLQRRRRRNGSIFSASLSSTMRCSLSCNSCECMRVTHVKRCKEWADTSRSFAHWPLCQQHF